jgi:hypothetical protein
MNKELTALIANLGQDQRPLTQREMEIAPQSSHDDIKSVVLYLPDQTRMHRQKHVMYSRKLRRYTDSPILKRGNYKDRDR